MGNFDYLLEHITEKSYHTQLSNDIVMKLNEELGIHDDVTKNSFLIMQKLEDVTKTLPKLYYANIDGASFKKGEFVFEMFGKQLKVFFRYTNFRDNSFYRTEKDKIPKIQNGFNYKELTLTIDVYAISGQIVETSFNDTIQHEIEHYFQEDKIGKPFAVNKMYKVGVFVKHHFGNNDEVAHKIGNLLYFSQKNEIEAYTNGLYSLLVKNYKTQFKPTLFIIEDSPVYQGLLQLRRDKEWLSNNKSNKKVMELLNVIRTKEPNGMGLNITVDEIIKFADRADVEIVRRIGRVITKAQKDCNVENDLNTFDWKYITKNNF